MNLWDYVEGLLEAWFLIRTALKAQGHASCDIALVALDSTNGMELDRKIVLKGVPLA